MKFNKNNKQINIVTVSGAYPDVGKGVFSASLSYLLMENSYSVSPLKFDGYMNYSSGTMNPYHKSMESKYSEEEVFVLDDGYETDVDSGYYERFLDSHFKHDSVITNGKLFSMLHEMEISGLLKYGEVLNYRSVRQLLAKLILKKAEESNFLVIEIGGTVGDKESEIIYDTLSLLKNQKKVNLYSILLSPYFKQEGSDSLELSFRSKITRQGYEKTWRLGLAPDAIVLRTNSTSEIMKNDIEYISLETNIPERNIFTDENSDSIYSLPSQLHAQEIDKNILSFFDLSSKQSKTKRLEKYVDTLRLVRKLKKKTLIGIFGKTISDDSYVSLKEAVEHAGVETGRNTEIIWLDDVKNYTPVLKKLDAIIIGEGLGYVKEKLACIQYARERDIPCLAISFGCDLLIKEYIENQLKQKVSIEELDQTGKTTIQKINLETGAKDITYTQAKHHIGSHIRERIRLNSSVSDQISTLLHTSKLKISGVDSKSKESLYFEHTSNTFLVGCKFHPEFLSHPGKPHILFVKLLKSIR